MYTRFQQTSKGVNAYIQKSVRVNGRSKTITVKCLGLLSDIQKREGCADPRKWVEDLAARMTQEEKMANRCIELELSPKTLIKEGERPLRHGGDLLLLPLYNRLGLPQICKDIKENSRVKYDLNEILQTLVIGRILFPCSKTSTYQKAKSMVKPPRFAEHDMFRALSLLSNHIDDIQAQVYRNSLSVMPRRDKVIFYDCTNYYFEIEEADEDSIDKKTGEYIEGIRRYGKSKEHRPNPIVQMGMFMDYDGIPLAFTLFPGNKSEQKSLQPLEEVLNNRFGMTKYVVSTDAGLASEDNRRYNMMEEREYICVQSIPSLKEQDRKMCIDPKGWRIAYRKNAEHRYALPGSDPDGEIYNLDELIKAAADNPGLLKDTTLYKEIIVEKGEGRRPERVIVTYNHDFALYLKRKRAENLKRAKKIINNKNTKSRQSQQDPRHYVTTIHKTKQGEKAVKVEMILDIDTIQQEEQLDGFYAYGTSLDDEAVDVLLIRAFHHEIEHLFRTIKTFLDARPVYVSRQDRIRSHFLICFLAMVILKMLQKQLDMSELTIDQLIKTLRDIRFLHAQGKGYIPAFERTDLSDRLQELAGVNVSTEIIPTRTMTANYRNVKV